MIALDCGDDFAIWRGQARQLLGHGIDPATVTWGQTWMDDLLAVPTPLPAGPGPFHARVPAALLAQLEQAGRYRGEQRWNLLYEVLWRVAHGDRTAMLAGDRLGSELQRRIRQGPLIPELVGQARHGKQRDGQALEIGRQQGKRIGAGGTDR
ncbi:hypothetical protein WR25_07296 [Diploscapter pachys]|uniref:Uncharacterized protein n=1 Tax=Diploscapter pachys TaxID=2018661 RepID=A0A2A2K9S8_9BILA|nr:hypothetical protein WR25_07296 [Diploscapter pachys]